MMTETPAAAKRGSWVATIIQFAVAAVLALAISKLVPKGPAAVGALLGAITAFLGVAAASRWSLPRQLVVFLVFVSCLEGPLKNLAPSSAIKYVAYVGRDLILYGALYLAYRRGDLRGWSARSVPGAAMIGAYVALVAIQVFNPRGFGPVISFLASRPYWEMIPLFFLGYALMTRPGTGDFARGMRGAGQGPLQSLPAQPEESQPRPERWASLTRVALWCGLANAIAAVVQYAKGPAWFGSLGPGYAHMVDRASARTFLDAAGILRLRPPGLGSDMGFAATMALYLWPLLLATWFHPRLKAAWSPLARVLTFVLLLLGVFVSESRSIILFSPLIIIVYLLLAVGGPAAEGDPENEASTRASVRDSVGGVLGGDILGAGTEAGPTRVKAWRPALPSGQQAALPSGQRSSLGGRIVRIALACMLLAAIANIGANMATERFPGLFDRYRSVSTLNRTVKTFVGRESRFNTAFTTPFTYFGQYFWGTGMGKVGPAGGVFVPDGNYKATDAENELLLMITETGSLATLCLLALHLRFVAWGFTALRKAPSAAARALAAIPLTTLLVMLLLWPLGNFVTFPGSAAFWFYGGTLAALGGRFGNASGEARSSATDSSIDGLLPDTEA